MTPRVADALRASDMLPDVGLDTKLSAIKMRNSSTQGGSLVSLLFVDEDPAPRYVLRMARDPARPERLASNFAALTRLTDVPGLRGSVPLPVFSAELDRVRTTLETYLDGSSVAMEMAVAERRGLPERAAAVLDHATSWLWRLHEPTWQPVTEEFRTRCAADVEVLTGRGFLQPDEASSVLSLADEAARGALPYAWCHGDFNPNNLLLRQDGESIGVVDWEYAGPGCALFDLYQFATISWLFPTWQSDMANRARQLWVGETPVGRAFLSALGRYADRSGLPAERLLRLFSLYVCRMAADLSRLVGARREKMFHFWRELLSITLAR
jgi:aminoglycoside phosphotransferase (APT) family kinase protein